MGGYGAGGSQADAQWRSPAPASSSASAPTAQGSSSKRTWSGQVRVMKQNVCAKFRLVVDYHELAHVSLQFAYNVWLVYC